MGKLSTNSMYLGTLCLASRSTQKARISSSVASLPSRRMMHAIASSPYFSSGTPMTCTSLTAAWV